MDSSDQNAEADVDSARKILSAPPFVIVDGVYNFRDIGSYPATGNGFVVKPAYVYRSADPSQITEKGVKQLRDLGIKKIFSFRSPLRANRASLITSMDGVDIVYVQVSKAEAIPGDMEKDLQLFAQDPTEAFRRMYRSMLETGGPAFGTIFKHVSENPDKPCLIHCAVGKDRTGVFSALYLSLLGVSEDDIVKDYVLSDYGIAPMRATLRARARTQPVVVANWEGALNTGKSLPQTIINFLKIVREEFGGVEEYLRTRGGLTDADITSIRRNVVVPIDM
ncbi:protein-tyrosine phosphatase-like protein [Cristinia sonorae]|uniref:Protein-tyrosine phosphatase-like protein n=1 Tax=Cristinia sonorae TaxID=1940300 RepID=A0A8K0UXH0_9AGAR|nr:protein-tyrosine phosphatase-like protein [Cristinia sonorae]